MDSFKKRTVNKFKSAIHYLSLDLVQLHKKLFLDMMLNKDPYQEIIEESDAIKGKYNCVVHVCSNN